MFLLLSKLIWLILGRLLHTSVLNYGDKLAADKCLTTSKHDSKAKRQSKRQSIDLLVRWFDYKEGIEAIVVTKTGTKSGTLYALE